MLLGRTDMLVHLFFVSESDSADRAIELHHFSLMIGILVRTVCSDHPSSVQSVLACRSILRESDS